MRSSAIVSALALAASALSPAVAATPVAYGSGTLALAGDTLTAFGILQPLAEANGSVVRGTYDSDAYAYTSAEWEVPATVAAWNLSAGGPVLQQVAFSGGLTLTAPFMRGVSTGGALTVSDLAIDFDLRRVSAMVSGDNGLATGRVDLFTWFEPENRSVTVTPFNRFLCCEGTPPNAERASFSYLVSDLQLTTEGEGAISQGLGLETDGIGRLALMGQPFGTLAVNVTLEGDLGQFTTPVPEPSTWAMMGVGLLAVAGLSRRRRQTLNA